MILEVADLVTSKEDYKKGFLEIALIKSEHMRPYVAETRSLEALTAEIDLPEDLLIGGKFSNSLLTAYGMSTKALNYLKLTQEDVQLLSKEFVENYLTDLREFRTEFSIRYTIIRGDTFGGKMKNLIGTLAKRKALHSIMASLNVLGIDFSVRIKESKKFVPFLEYELVDGIDAIHWHKDEFTSRILLFDKRSPIVKTNIDIILIESDRGSIKESLCDGEKYIACGELKGGIDPAGSDEHWKTANEALRRVRKVKESINTFFIGAAIENRVADEIKQQLESGILTAAANLNHDSQVADLCNWLVSL